MDLGGTCIKFGLVLRLGDQWKGRRLVKIKIIGGSKIGLKSLPS